jgi:uncharacterized protein YqhQ
VDFLSFGLTEISLAFTIFAMNKQLPPYGGQAVIEGVMMRGAQSVAIAMRAPTDEIVVHTEKLTGIYKSQIGKIPFLRGLVVLWDALGLGMRALTISANTQTGEEEKLEGPQLYITLGIALVLGIGLFFLLPAAIGQFSERWFSISAWWGNLLEGVMRLGLLVFYIWAIGRTPDIQRVFAYHGAEHKTINTFEAGEEVTLENALKFPLEHPRCGTTFLVTLGLISVILFSLLGPLPMGLRLLSRILLLPVVAMISYEYIRWTANHMDTHLVQILAKPGLALQRLTTREPTPEMLEVSIAAFNAMRTQEGQFTL